MQGARAPQPSGTNRPSSCLPFLPGTVRDERFASLCGPEGAEATRPPRARRRSAAMAGGEHPVPCRTRKLSPRAPMVLPVQPVGQPAAADQRRARDSANPRGALRGPSSLFWGASEGANLRGRVFDPPSLAFSGFVEPSINAPSAVKARRLGVLRGLLLGRKPCVIVVFMHRRIWIYERGLPATGRCQRSVKFHL